MKRKNRSEFPLKVRKMILERTGNRCERCGIDFDEDFKGEFHHIIPIINGGKSSIENCSLLCPNCHYVAPNLKSKEELPIYYNYFIKFASFKEASRYYNVNTRIEVYLKIAQEIAKSYKKTFNQHMR